MNLFWYIFFFFSLTRTSQPQVGKLQFDLLPLDHDSKVLRKGIFGLKTDSDKNKFEMIADALKIKSQDNFEWHSAVINYFRYAVDKMKSSFMNVETIHKIFKEMESMENFSNLFIYYSCLRLKKSIKNRKLSVEERSRYFNPNLCPSPCKLVRCDNITYAIKNSCKDHPNAFYDDEYSCSCLSPWIWNQTSKLCVKPNYKDICKKE